MSYFLYGMSKHQGSVAFDCLELTESSFCSYILPQSDASKWYWRIVFEKPSFEQVSCNINVISWSSSTCRENTLRLWCLRCYIEGRRKIKNCGGTALQRYLFIKLKGKLSKVERSTYHLLQNLWRVLIVLGFFWFSFLYFLIWNFKSWGYLQNKAVKRMFLCVICCTHNCTVMKSLLAWIE